MAKYNLANKNRGLDATVHYLKQHELEKSLLRVSLVNVLDGFMTVA